MLIEVAAAGPAAQRRRLYVFVDFEHDLVGHVTLKTHVVMDVKACCAVRLVRLRGNIGRHNQGQHDFDLAIMTDKVGLGTTKGLLKDRLAVH